MNGMYTHLQMSFTMVKRCLLHGEYYPPDSTHRDAEREVFQVAVIFELLGDLIRSKFKRHCLG